MSEINGIHPDNIDVMISLSEYTRLNKAADWLSYLEAAGVDNWEGYDFARELQREDKINSHKTFAL